MRATLLLLACLAAQAPAASWVRIRSPQIELLTDAGEKTGRQIFARFQEIHGVFHAANIADSPLPVRIFVFASTREFVRYREGAATEAFYQSGPERDYIVMHTGRSAPRIAFHEYVHLILNHSSLLLPKWFEEGTAEFYSTLETARGRLVLGRPMESHLASLAAGKWLTVEQLASASGTERDRAGMFYAQSWVLVHMLNLAPGWRDGMPSFAVLLAEGRAPDDAFRSAFGRRMDEALADLSGYLTTMRPVSIPATAIDTAPPAEADRVTVTEAAVARADLAIQTGRREVARALLPVTPETPAAAAALGRLALAEDRRDDARRYLDRAITLGSQDAGTYFEYAMLERDTGAKRDRVDQLLEKTLAVNPNFAEAHLLLGVHATDDGRYAEAVEHLNRAIRILPRQSYFWHALGYAQWKLGRSHDALESARHAVATAGTASEAGMAETLVSLTRNEMPGASPVQKPAVTTPPSWEGRKGDARIQGVLSRVDCRGSSAHLQIDRPHGQALVLTVLHPDEVEMLNAPDATRQIACGPQAVAVVVDYVATTGEVTRIEFQR